MPINNAQVGVSLRADLSSALDLGTAVFGTNLARGQNFDPGTGAGQVDKIFTDTRTIAISGSEDLDLAGVLLDAFGATITFARLKAVLISAAPGNTNNVIVGGVASGLATMILPTATGQVVVRPGGGVCFWCGGADATGYVVTSGTADLLHVANSGAGTSVTYDIAILGCSA
jgi:hypothetical protein